VTALTPPKFKTKSWSGVSSARAVECRCFSAWSSSSSAGCSGAGWLWLADIRTAHAGGGSATAGLSVNKENRGVACTRAPKNPVYHQSRLFCEVRKGRGRPPKSPKIAAGGGADRLAAGGGTRPPTKPREGQSMKQPRCASRMYGIERARRALAPSRPPLPPPRFSRGDKYQRERGGQKRRGNEGGSGRGSESEREEGRESKSGGGEGR
jgi:hypothetical protein